MLRLRNLNMLVRIAKVAHSSLWLASPIRDCLCAAAPLSPTFDGAAVVQSIQTPLPRLAVEDMLAQGANSVTELLLSSVSPELGRPAVDKELEGDEYASSLAICNGTIKATKSRGFKGFSELLGAAKVDGDLMLCERHMEKLQGRLMTTSSPPFPYDHRFAIHTVLVPGKDSV